jgi:hypothetical protein
MDSKEVWCEVVDCVRLPRDRVHEHSASIKGGEFLYELIVYYHLKKDSASCIS